MTDEFERIYALVRRIPSGRVTTYGQLGALCALADARIVGEAMKASTDLPWQRVINARGQVSLGGARGASQRRLLEAEGVEFDEAGRVDLARFGWTPDEEWLKANGYRTPAREQDEGGEQLGLW